MKKKIAPKLRAYIGAGSFLGPKECQKELRALLTLADAADKTYSHCKGSPSSCLLCTALDKLERASGIEPRKI